MEPETFFAIARPSGCHGGEETIGERFFSQFHKDSAIATGAAKKLSQFSDVPYEVYRVKIEVLERVA